MSTSTNWGDTTRPYPIPHYRQLGLVRPVANEGLSPITPKSATDIARPVRETLLSIFNPQQPSLAKNAPPTNQGVLGDKKKRSQAALAAGTA